jgi:tRNA pseudouridine38-40 synthase
VLGRPAPLTVAGRTDAGVHAWGQVASFELAGELPDQLARRLSAVLPGEIAIIDAVRAPTGFDARGDARARTYCYRVLCSPVQDPFEVGRALWWPHAVDRAALDRCAAALVGSHDFTAFTPTQTDHVRFHRDVARAEWRLRQSPEPFPGELLELWIEADSFMRHMVRVLVGTMLEVAGGRRSPDQFEELLRGAPREQAGETAPPHGLYLASVGY